MSYASVIIPKPGHPTLRTPWLTVLIHNAQDGHATACLHLSADEFRAFAAGCIKAAERMERAAQTEPAESGMTALFKITCRFTGALRFEGEFGSLKLCIEAAKLMEHAAASACDDVLAERVPA